MEAKSPKHAKHQGKQSKLKPGSGGGRGSNLKLHSILCNYFGLGPWHYYLGLGASNPNKKLRQVHMRALDAFLGALFGVSVNGLDLKQP